MKIIKIQLAEGGNGRTLAEALKSEELFTPEQLAQRATVYEFFNFTKNRLKHIEVWFDGDGNNPTLAELIAMGKAFAPEHMGMVVVEVEVKD